MPDPSLTFLLASCQYPAGLMDRHVAEASYRRMGQYLDACAAAGKPWPKWLVLVGDQVYVDATAGLFDPTTPYEAYERPHVRLYHGEAQNVMRRLTTYAMLDDHELQDNWERVDPCATPDLVDDNLRVLKLGRDAYLKFQRAAVPLDDGVPTEQLWYRRTLNRVPFFWADTRTGREPRRAKTIGAARIMVDKQRDDLFAFLAEQTDGPKFVASPAILLPRRLRASLYPPASALHSDAWDGYPASLYELLAYIADREIRNVVFVSGDEHLSCVTRADITAPSGKTTAIHSVHSSPLYAPFPFANSVPEELIGGETFKFDGGYTCTVKTEFGPPGDGFAILRAWHDGGVWKLDVEFDRADGRKTMPRVLGP